MKIRPIALLVGMLLILASALIIGCSSIPPTPVPNLSESEVISLVKDEAYRCWYTKESTRTPSISDFIHTESASFRPSGIWVIEAKSYWKLKSINPKRGYAVTFSNQGPFECIYVVDDSTEK